MNFDLVLGFILQKTSAIIKFSPQSLFYNADINGDGTLEFDEFTRILKCFEPEFFFKHRLGLQALFEEFADQIDEGEKVVSKEGFVVISNHFNIFGQKSHEDFLQLSSQKVGNFKQGFVKTVDELRLKWGQIKIEIADK